MTAALAARAQRPWTEPLQAQLRGLARWASMPADVAQALDRVLQVLTQDLPPQAGPPFDGLSAINADGLPFQWSASFGTAPSVRWLCESGPAGASPQRRAERALQRLREARAALGHAEASCLDEVVLPELLPAATDWPAHWRSAVWIGVAGHAGGIGFKPYFNLNRGTPRQRWQRVARLLAALGWGLSLKRWCEWSSRVSPGSWPVGLALDLGAGASPRRVKVYFRGEPSSAAWLQRWYEVVHGPSSFTAVRALLDAFPFAGAADHPPNSMVTSLELHTDGGASLKTDLGVTRWMGDDQAIACGTRRLMQAVGAGAPETLDAFLRAAAQRPDRSAPRVFRFVGLGLEPDGAAHVNVYIEPRPAAPAEPPAALPGPPLRGPWHAVDEAIQSAMAFLHGTPGPARWSDFELPVGAADEWVTAYVLWTLGDPALLPATLRRRARRALDWLLARRRAGAGWGYSQRCASDSDSTALALLALRAQGHPEPEESLRTLQGAVDASGGVATYAGVPEAAGSWAAACTDVAAVAAAALSRCAPERADEIGGRLDAELASQRAGGFWWLSASYADAMACTLNLPALGTAARRAIAQRAARCPLPGAFDRALQLQALVRLGGGAELQGRMQALAALQRGDGSWAPSAWLRLVHPPVADPQQGIDVGRVFVDTQAVFSTATALRALREARRRIDRVEREARPPAGAARR